MPVHLSHTGKFTDSGFVQAQDRETVSEPEILKGQAQPGKSHLLAGAKPRSRRDTIREGRRPTLLPGNRIELPI